MSRTHTNRNNLVLIVLLLIAALSNPSLKGQSKPSILEELWINVPSSPLEISFSQSKRDSMLYNRSSGTIVGYRLGCVTKDDNTKIKVVREGTLVGTDLQPAKGLINSISVHTDDLERCLNTDTHLAVIEVLFKDGFAWKAAASR